MPAEIELAKQWRAKADNDLLNADNNLQAARIPYDTVCFHCQQAAEKMLKAFLVVKGVFYPLTHDLLLLLEKVLPLDPSAAQLRDALALLTPYAVEARYPDEMSMPAAQDAFEARAAAASIGAWLRTACPALFD